MKFVPTWLYVKQHKVTGLKYFGKTIRDPYKYVGSGKYWKKHIKTHGKNIDTIWCELFTNESAIKEFAEFFSKHYNIVNSVDSNGRKIWANEIPENGLHGGQNAGMKSPLKGKPTGRPSWSKGKNVLIMQKRCQVENKLKSILEKEQNHLNNTREHRNTLQQYLGQKKENLIQKLQRL